MVAVVGQDGLELSHCLQFSKCPLCI